MGNCSDRLQIVPIGRLGKIQHAEPGAQRPRSLKNRTSDHDLNLSKDSTPRFVNSRSCGPKAPRLVDTGSLRSMLSTVSEPGAPTKCKMSGFVTMNDDESKEPPP